MCFFTPAQQHISAPLCSTFPARQQQHISAPLTLVIMAICCYNERYDNMRRCRNDAFIETCCDKLACYNKHFDRIQLRCMVVFIEADCDELVCYNTL